MDLTLICPIGCHTVIALSHVNRYRFYSLSFSYYSILTYNYIEIDLLRLKRVIGRVLLLLFVIFFLPNENLTKNKKKMSNRTR